MPVLDLLDYRRRVAAIYEDVRTGSDAAQAWQSWTLARQELFASHPESAWAGMKRTSRRLAYFPHNPDWRFEAEVEPIRQGTAVDIGHSGTGSTAFTPLGIVRLAGTAGATLTLFWLTGYGGGLFLPFRDGTSGNESYGGGRYLLDTVKGADLGSRADRLIIDFNYAYHPSCVHSPRWSCPLAPVENHLSVRVEAGERLP